MIGTLERYKVTDAARQDYLASFEGDRFAESMRYVQCNGFVEGRDDAKLDTEVLR